MRAVLTTLRDLSKIGAVRFPSSLIHRRKRTMRGLCLWALVALGTIYPLSHLIDLRGEVITALNTSPHHTVFVAYPFFSKIVIDLEYEHGKQTTTAAEFVKATNMYYGKVIYSLFYMNYIFKQPAISALVMRWYFCNKKQFASTLTYLKDLKTVKLTYVHRRTNEVNEARQISCADGTR